jgi:hypothetical protein
MAPNFQVATACFSCNPPEQNSCSVNASKLCNSPLIQKIEILRPLSEANTSNHLNIFTSILPFSERRAGEAWEPANKMKLFFSRP